MSVNGVAIKVGQKWRTRNGKTAEVIAGPDSDVTYCWCVEMIPSGPKWTANDKGEQLHNTSGPWDLTFLVEDPDLTLTQPAAFMVDEIKTTPHPLRRAADWPQVAAAVDDTAGLPPEPAFLAALPDPLRNIMSAPAEPQFENSLPGALLGPDEALKDLQVKEGDPRTQQTADSHKRRAADAERDEPIPLVQERTSFMQALADMKPGSIVRVEREVPADPTRTDEHEVEFRANTDDTQQSALDRQIGGGHYKQFAIQPVEFIHKNALPFIEGNCIKYLCRWRDKGGIADLEKVKHYVDLLIELENGNN